METYSYVTSIQVFKLIKENKSILHRKLGQERKICYCRCVKQLCRFLALKDWNCLQKTLETFRLLLSLTKISQFASVCFLQGENVIFNY